MDDVVGYQELKEITDRAGELYPRKGHQRSWWAARGVDYEGLQQFCLEDAIDTFENVMPQLTADAPLSDVIGGGYAMQTEVGFLLGWLACEQNR